MITGSKKLVKRAKVLAKYLGVKSCVYVHFSDFDFCAGYCVKIADDSYNIAVSRALHKSMWVEVVGHELVHVKQYETGRLVDTPDGTLWLGKYHHLDSENKLVNLLAPWEMEARAYEEVLREVWENR